MTKITHIAAIGAILMMTATGYAAAGEYVGRGGVIRDYGSIKDHRNHVPVPAPNPANEPHRDWYVRGDLGYGFYSDSDSADHFFGGIGFGRYFTHSIRGDLTLDFKESQGRSYTGLANLYYDFDRHRFLRPYIGAGIGGAKFNEGGNQSYGLAVAAMAGFTVDITPTIKLDSGYRFTWADAQSTDGVDDHAIRVGLRLDIYP